MPDWAVNIGVGGRDSGAAGVFKRLSKGADDFGRHASSAFNQANKSGFSFMSMARGLLPVISVATGIAFINKSIDAWKVQEAAVANVEAGLKSTGNAAGLSSQQLQKMAAALQGKSIFGDEAVLQNSTAQLLTFTNITYKNFERVQNVAADVTSKLKGINATGEDLKGVSLMMGKAMENPIRGLTAMRRIGISFTDQEEMVVRQMMAANDTIGAQNFMLKAIERQYGGTAEALSRTSAGMAKMRENRIGDMMETIGQKMLPMKITFLSLVDSVLPALTAAFEVLGNAVQMLQPVINGIKKAFKIIGPYLPEIVAGFVAWQVATEAIVAVKFASELVSWAKYLWMMREFVTKAAVAQWLLNLAMSANPIALIVIGITALTVAIVFMIRHWDLVKQKFFEFTKVFDNPVIAAIGTILMPFITIPILIARNWIKSGR